MQALAQSLASRLPAVPEVADPSGLLAQVASTELPADIAGMSLEEPVLQGYLKVEWLPESGEGEAPGLPPDWRRCWVLMRKDRLEVYRARPEEPSSGSAGSAPVALIPLSHVTGIAAELPGCPIPNAFQLSTHVRLWTLCAPLEAARRHWLTAIAGALVAARNAAAQALEASLAALAVQLVKAEQGRSAAAAAAAAATAATAGAAHARSRAGHQQRPAAAAAPTHALPTALRQPTQQHRRGGAEAGSSSGHGRGERSVKFHHAAAPAEAAAAPRGSGRAVALQDLADQPLEMFAAGAGSSGSSLAEEAGLNSYVNGASDEETHSGGDSSAMLSVDSPPPASSHASRPSSSSSSAPVLPRGTPGGAFTLRRSMLLTGGLTQSSLAKYKDPVRANSSVMSVVEPQRLSRAAEAAGSSSSSSSPSKGAAAPLREAGAALATAAAAAAAATSAAAAIPAAAVPSAAGRARLDIAKLWVNSLRSAEGGAIAALPVQPATAAAAAAAAATAKPASAAAAAAAAASGLGAAFANGVLLCSVLEAALRVKVEDVALKPRARAQCIGNLEKGIAVSGAQLACRGA